MMSEVILEARNIRLEYVTRINLFKTFRHVAIEKLSLKLYKGEVLGIAGRNGSGKSTLLKILAGIFAPDAGDIVVKKGITRALLSLGLGFNVDLSGRDNAMLSCMLNGKSKRDSKKIVEGIKEFSELGEFFDQPVRTYSSGMKAKLGFATGVVCEVDILLVDEVLSVGDKYFRDKAEKVMLDKMKGNQTVVFVSHSEEQMDKLCDRVIKL